MQSYQNVSNSQPLHLCKNSSKSCKRLCKVIKMLAIHNALELSYHIRLVANAFAKLSKCQQFTTKSHLEIFLSQLQTLMQSYQNVSNSQPIMSIIELALSCKRLCKVIKMLAIHNFLPRLLKLKFVANAYAKLSKCQQFTTISN